MQRRINRKINCRGFKNLPGILLRWFLLLWPAHLLAYDYSLPVTVSAPDSALGNRTVRVRINDTTAPDFEWANACADLLPVDDADNPLDHFLERCNVTARDAILWVEVPNIPASPDSVTFTVWYADDSATSASDAAATFDNVGMKFHTQPYRGRAPGPQSLAEGKAAFDFNHISTNNRYGCTSITNSRVNNGSQFGSRRSIAYHFLSVFEAPVAGTYGFRMGGDFGYGGQASVDDQIIEADWTTDLWWAYNYNHIDVMSGNVVLDAGFHTFWAFGYEGCCDGTAGIQIRAPGDIWRDFSSSGSGLTMFAPDCPVEDADVKTDEIQQNTELEIVKTVSDDSPNVGDTITFFLSVTNTGAFPATDVSVIDFVPAGFGAVSDISDGGAFGAGNEVVWTLPNLPVNAPVVLRFNAVVQR